MKIRLLLESIPNSWWFKVEAGAVGGIPDLIGHVNGHFVALELKTDTGRLSKLQEYILDKINQRGGYARVVRPANMEAILAELKLL